VQPLFVYWCLYRYCRNFGTFDTGVTSTPQLFFDGPTSVSVSPPPGVDQKCFKEERSTIDARRRRRRHQLVCEAKKCGRHHENLPSASIGITSQIVSFPTIIHPSIKLINHHASQHDFFLQPATTTTTPAATAYAAAVLFFDTTRRQRTSAAQDDIVVVIASGSTTGTRFV
jgi:hypothetical protein